MKRMFKLKPVLCVCLLSMLSFPVYGGVAKGDFGVGLNYPGLGMRYFLSDGISVELKGQVGDDIVIGGLRGYYYFTRDSKVLLFAGLEGDFVSFKGDESKGTGYVGELFVGGETFFVNSLSVQLDIGPAYIFLKDDDTSKDVSGVEYVANFSINFYFGK